MRLGSAAAIYIARLRLLDGLTSAAAAAAALQDLHKGNQQEACRANHVGVSKVKLMCCAVCQ